MTNSPKYLAVYEVLKQTVDACADGEKLPPVKELCETCQVSLATLLSALNLLEKDGMIRREPKKGIYCTKGNSPARKLRITLLLPGEQEPLFVAAITACHRFCKSRGVELKVESFELDPKSELAELEAVLRDDDCCGLLYLDAPVLDICSWPGGLGAGLGEESCWKECKEIYHLNDETALTFTGNPLDRTKELAKTGIPVMLVCGDADRYVPYAENGEPFYEKMKEAGADIMHIVKPGCDHHPHSLSDPAPVVDFIEKHYGIK